MKIYPNRSIITVTKEVNHATDIALSYIDTNAISYNINTVIGENYKIKEKKEILPYDRMASNSICLFDKYNNQIDKDILMKNFHREGKEYIYVPFGSQSFEPQRFDYNVIGKKIMKYSSNMLYNMNILIANNPELANRFISICGDAPSRLIAPANVTVNNADLSIASLTEGNMKEKDFIMMMFKDTNTILEYNYYTDDYEEVEFDATEIFDSFLTNIIAVYKEDTAIKDWEDEDKNSSLEITCKNSSYINTNIQLMISKENNLFRILDNVVYKDICLNSKLYFKVPNNTNTIKYHNVFDTKAKAPILIEEHIGKGFIIYMTESLIDSAINNSKLIYESLLKVFFNAYLKTKTIEEWIADKVPDYIVSNKKLIKKDKFISNIELHKMFGINSDEITPYEVIIDKELYPFVEFTGMSKKYLTFEKIINEETKKYSDPLQPESTLSIYTQNQNIIFFNDFIYSINDSIEDCIKVDRANDKLIVNLKAFKHSGTGIHVKYNIDPIVIPLIEIIDNKEQQIQNADFYLIVKSNESVSYFEIVNSDNYTDSMGNILATIQIRQDATEKIIYDMRQRGGGLALDKKDDFNCFDMGHINGRPYRKAGSLIITLPNYLKAHESTIMETIKQHSCAEDYPIIIFEED